MVNYYEGRSEACWVCKFFIQADETYRNGFCCRKAPTKADQNAGDAGTPYGDAEFIVFAGVPDPETGSCGEFVPCEEDFIPSGTIPAQEPGTPV